MTVCVSYVAKTYKLTPPTITFTRSVFNLIINLVCCAVVKVNPFGPMKDVKKYLWILFRGLFGGIQITCYFFAFTKVSLSLLFDVDSCWRCHNTHFFCSSDYRYSGYFYVEWEMGCNWCSCFCVLLCWCSVHLQAFMAFPWCCKCYYLSVKLASSFRWLVCDYCSSRFCCSCISVYCCP